MPVNGDEADTGFEHPSGEQDICPTCHGCNGPLFIGFGGQVEGIAGT
jgi:hypothetical protein